jgi:hypothetical protein
MWLIGLALLGTGAARAAEEAPPAGTWKFLLPTDEGRPALVALVRFSAQDGRWTGKVLARARGLSSFEVENVTVRDGLLRCTVKLATSTLRLECPVPKEKGVKMGASLVNQGNASPVELEPTALTSLDEFEVAREAITRQKGGVETVQLALTLLSQATEKKAKPEEVRSWAARAVKAAEAYGPPWHRAIVLKTAEILAEQKGFEAVALTYARQAERLMDPQDPPALRKRVLDALAVALVKAGKEDEAKEVAARIAKIDFAIKAEPYAGRKGKSDRAVLVELFTGAQCPPCVAADLAFDALGKTFKPSEVVRLQYHLHVPGPDPLTNPDGEARAEQYGRAIEGTPTVLFNGKPVAPGGGGREDAPEKYAEYRTALEPLLETPSGASVKVTATRKGTRIDIPVEASVPAGAGDRLRLRLVLVEDQVAYTGGNRIAEHHQVVRAFPGGTDGERLVPGKPLRKTVTVDVEEVRQKLKNYLDKMAKEVPFPSKDRPLDLKNLRVVAFVQNDATQEVLQAVQAEVAEQ